MRMSRMAKKKATRVSPTGIVRGVHIRSSALCAGNEKAGKASLPGPCVGVCREGGGLDIADGIIAAVRTGQEGNATLPDHNLCTAHHLAREVVPAATFLIDGGQKKRLNGSGQQDEFRLIL